MIKNKKLTLALLLIKQGVQTDLTLYFQTKFFSAQGDFTIFPWEMRWEGKSSWNTSTHPKHISLENFESFCHQK